MNATSRKVTLTRHEYVAPIPYPNGWAKDVADAMFLCTQAMKERGIQTSSDDAIRVRLTDDEIIFWFEVKQ
jgi:hypothetical protein